MTLSLINSNNDFDFVGRVIKTPCQFNKLTSLLCVCPVVDHEFCHNIVKLAVDPRGDSRVDPQTKFIVNNRTDALKTDINLFFL